MIKDIRCFENQQRPIVFTHIEFQLLILQKKLFYL